LGRLFFRHFARLDSAARQAAKSALKSMKKRTEKPLAIGV
jgi:hypothetical protein